MNCSPSRLVFLSLVISSSLAANTINVPADSSTIQSAINGAVNGDTVLVQPGTYYENIIWPEMNGIKLISAGDSSNTIIDGDTIGSVIYMNPSTATIDSTTEIQGFKITNGGNIANGGGLFISSASPTLTQLWAAGNTATVGGGLYIRSGEATLTGVTVTGNTAKFYGGGLYIDTSSAMLSYVTVTGNAAREGGGLYIDSGSPTLTDVTVIGNTANGYFGGGLLMTNYSYPSLSDLNVRGNTANGFSGGGLYIVYGSPTLTDVTVNGNTADSHGGGISIRFGSPTLTGVTVTGNTTARDGGGLSIVHSTAVLTDVTETGNTASGYGGGLNIVRSAAVLRDVTVTGNTSISTYAGGGGLFISGPDSTRLTDVTVSGNTATVGGGLFIDNYSSPTLTRITVSRNIGAGLYFKNSNGSLVNVTISGNTSGIYVESGAPTIAGSNIAYNRFGLYNADTTKIIDADSVWWGHSSGPYQPNQNPTGQGDSTNAFVDVTPFLTEPDASAPPIPVQNLHTTDTSATSISLAWDSSPIGDLAGYRLYFNYDSTGFPYSDTTDVGISTAYMLENLLTQRIYYLAVTCYDDQGNESWYSNEVSVSLGDFIAPTAPGDLTGVAEDSKVQLSWRPVIDSDFKQYRVYGNDQPNPIILIDSTDSILDTTITINDLVNGTTYSFRVTAVDTLQNESGYSNEVSVTPDILSVGIGDPLPTVFALHQNYPNPFNPTSTIQYDLPEAAAITLVVYDILGREVITLVDQEIQPGYHKAIWDARDHAGRTMPTGIYIARLVTPEYAKSIKMLLLK